MPRRLLTLLIVALVALSATACEKPTGYAAKVGSDVITEDELTEWMDVFSASPTLQNAVFGGTVNASALAGTAPNTYTMQFADAVLGILIEGTIHEQEFQRRHLETDAALEQQIHDQVLTTLETELKDAKVEVSDDLNQRLTELFAHRNAVITALADDWQTWVTAQYERDDIDVNAKYGSWTPTASVQPPTGPLAAPTGS